MQKKITNTYVKTDAHAGAKQEIETEKARMQRDLQPVIVKDNLTKALLENNDIESSSVVNSVKCRVEGNSTDSSKLSLKIPSFRMGKAIEERVRR